MRLNFLANRSAAIDARTKNERARRVRLSAGLGGVFTSNVCGNACQVAAKLVAPAVDSARERLRDSCAVKRKVSERDNIVITAMVKENPRNYGKLLSYAAPQLEIVEMPPILIPRWSSKQEQASNWFLNFLL